MKDKYMNTKVYTLDVEIGKKFAGICGVPFNDSRKGYFDDVIGFSRSYDTGDVSWFTESSEANKEFKELSVEFILRAAALEDKTEGDFWAGLESSINEEKPRTKVEYVKVTDSIFDLRPDFEAGELFSKVNHARDYSTINNTQTLAQALHQSCCYRRIETPMTERDEFIEVGIGSLGLKRDNTIGANLLGNLYDSGKFKLVN